MNFLRILNWTKNFLICAERGGPAWRMKVWKPGRFLCRDKYFIYPNSNEVREDRFPHKKKDGVDRFGSTPPYNPSTQNKRLDRRCSWEDCKRTRGRGQYKNYKNHNYYTVWRRLTIYPHLAWLLLAGICAACPFFTRIRPVLWYWPEHPKIWRFPDAWWQFRGKNQTFEVF